MEHDQEEDDDNNNAQLRPRVGMVRALEPETSTPGRSCKQFSQLQLE
jgi:hypothetical protein